MSDELRNKDFTLIRGHLYRIRSRNLPYGIYDGNGGFTGIREKFLSLYLFTEYDYDQGAPYGTVTVIEDLGAAPEDIEPVCGWWRGDDGKDYVHNTELYDLLVVTEQLHGRGTGYGTRPGDELPG